MEKHKPSTAHKHDHRGHGHGHHGHHHHHHGSITEKIGWAFVLNLIFALIELAGGIWTNSVAIISDAIHDFGDALALGTAYLLEKKSQQGADARFTYGYRRWSLLSAVLTGIILIAGTIFVWIEAIHRLAAPEPVNSVGMFGLAILGILVNGFSLMRFRGGKSHNERMLSWHFIEDLAGWVIVCIASIALYFFNLPQLDSVLALMLTGWISLRVIQQLVSVGSIFLQALPPGIHIAEIEKRLAKIAVVQSCHHTHLWTLDGEQHILTTHVLLKEELKQSALVNLKTEIRGILKDEYQVLEATIEFECPGEDCADPSHGH